MLQKLAKILHDKEKAIDHYKRNREIMKYYSSELSIRGNIFKYEDSALDPLTVSSNNDCL